MVLAKGIELTRKKFNFIHQSAVQNKDVHPTPILLKRKKLTELNGERNFMVNVEDIQILVEIQREKRLETTKARE